LKKLITYLTCAYPDPSFTIELALKLKENGTDIIELGIPFSDPVADGPVIEKANKLALESGFKMSQLYEVSKQIAPQIDTYWMGYFNMFFSKGIKQIALDASSFGVKGFIIPDLPHEEAFAYRESFSSNDISLVSFVAPTDSPRRIKKLVGRSQGFVYLVAYAGITGSAQSEELDSIIEEIRKQTQTPLYLGFGVNEQNAKEKAQDVDGVIVGSEFIKILIDETLTNNQKIDTICALSSRIKEAINS
jgi:tryptophan synthase alpha chain